MDEISILLDRGAPVAVTVEQAPEVQVVLEKDSPELRVEIIATGPPGPTGPGGPAGQDGQDGVSPGVTVETIIGGHRVTITDADHPEGQAFNVMDGTEAFWATYGTTSSAQIEAAYQAGKVCLCAYGGNVYTLAYRGSAAVHTFTVYLNTVGYYVRCSSDAWASGSIGLAPANSPTLTGTPTAPTAPSGTNTQQLATTAFVHDAIPAVPAAYASDPADLGTKSPGSSDKFARGDHVHEMPSAGDVGAIPAPASPASGDVPVFNGSAWVTENHAHDVLYITAIPCSAMTGDFASASNAGITADHVLAECVFADPTAVTADVTWTTASGSLVLNGACAAATTCSVVLIKKNN